MRTLTLKLTAAITGRRMKPPIPDEELTTLKEQARRLLEDMTTTATAPPVHRPLTAGFRDVFTFGPPPQPTYEPGPSRVQAMSTVQPFGSEPTGEKRPGKLMPGRRVSGWDIAWARLTPSEIAWSSQP